MSTDMHNGIWVKTQFKRQGHILSATTYCVAAGNPKVLSFSIDLRPLEVLVRRYHARQHAEARGKTNPQKSLQAVANTQKVHGFFDFVEKPFKAIGHEAAKLGHLKLLKVVSKAMGKIADEAKMVVKSKITGLVLSGLSVIQPEIGLPAMAAYAAAHTAFDAIDKGKEAVSAVENIAKASGLVKSASAAVKKIGAAAAQTSLAAHPALKAKITQALIVVKAAKGLTPALVQKATADHGVAMAALQKIAADLKNANPSIRANAQKNMNILKLVAAERQKARAVAVAHLGGIPGLHIDPKGNITKGRFVRTGPGTGFLYGAKTEQQGTFKKVGHSHGGNRNGGFGVYTAQDTIEDLRQPSVHHVV